MTEFCDALAERARAGVRVHVLLDGIGSGLDLEKADVERLKQAGCSFAFYHPIASLRIDRVNRRTHRRILVVDGRVGFTGGVGFSDEWLGDADAPNHWRKVHARLEGPIVGKLQAAFQDHWFKEVGETLSGSGEFPELPAAGISAPRWAGDAGGIRTRFNALKALHARRLRETIVMGPIHRMGDAAVSFAGIDATDAKTSAHRVRCLPRKMAPGVYQQAI